MPRLAPMTALETMTVLTRRLGADSEAPRARQLPGAAVSTARCPDSPQ